MTGRLKAILFLAWALLSTLVRRTLGRKHSGFERFHENYAADRLTSVSVSQRLAMSRFGRCIACGRCNRGDGSRVLSSKGEFRGTMSLVLAASRSMPEYRAAQVGFAHLSESELRKKELECPVGVPLVEMSHFVADHARSANRSAPPASHLN